jgi:pseudouridine-5'-phosphate glycosidase
MNTASLLIAPEVAAAQARGQAVVALESTIIAHGMPWPENLHTAQAVEQVVREHGAVPATIALLDGQICIGLTPEQLQQVAQDPGMMKASRRDLGFAVAMRRNAATTVSATMICAHLGGIEVFVTGGIGGVHREASTTFDISADLQELARTPVAVVCAGAKSILDLGLTLEYLETQGVPVISRGQANFAAFYTQDSGLAADQRIDSAADQARLIRAHWQLGLHSGVVLSNPIPDADAIARATMDSWIAQALADARAQGISGKASTPFLLARIKELSGGASLKANQALVLHNARVGAELAVALAAQR